LGGLVFGQRRGGVSDIVSLNFDDVLESYFRLHGYDAQSVTALPTLLRKDSVKIFHIHGFLSQPAAPRAESSFLVFSRKSADERIRGADPMKAVIVHILRTKLCLFIGMSEKTAMDYLLSPLLDGVGKKTAKHSRPTGFWIFGEGPRGRKRGRNRVPEEVRDHLKELNVVPLVFSTYEKVAEFLFDVCGTAGQRLDSLRSDLVSKEFPQVLG
jgi:hypothetical protein